MKFSLSINLNFFLLLLNFYQPALFTQQTKISGYQYLSPTLDAHYVSPYTNIIIRQGEIIDGFTLKNNLIEVTGSKSGMHKGKFFLADDKKTLLYNPIFPFFEGEKVTVKLKNGIKTFSGKNLNGFSYSFFISSSWKQNMKINSSNVFAREFDLIINKWKNSKPIINVVSFGIDTLPEDLPNIYVTITNSPSDGNIFIAPWFFQGSFFDPNYLMIIDNYGTPIFYRRNDVLALDFKLQPTGVLTYHDQGADAFIGMDSSYSVIDTFRCGNGYPTDFHDIQLLANGHYLIMGQDYQTVRMDTIVPGGDSAAIVIGQIVQEKDENHNVIFQWRSWDHFLITDASDNIDLTAHTIDYVHGNSIELDNDANLILSCRNMNEITKINRSTGELIWRMGGENNQFQFVNDPRGFTYQHDARRIDNGNLTIFDNGSLSNPLYTSSLEYIVNEVDTTVNLTWSYSDINHFSSAMGNSQRLANGNTFIGWGTSWNPAATEVDYNGNKIFEINFDSLFYSYRAFRFPWRTNKLIADNYRIDFEYIPVNTENTKEIIITNNSSEELQITSYYSRTSMFSVVDNFPVILQPNQNKILQIRFFPDSVGVFSDEIHLRMQKENEMIAQVIKVLGYSDPNATVEFEKNYLTKYTMRQNYPNPFNPATTIEYQIPVMSFVTIKVYDVLGNEIATLVNEEKPAGEYNVEFRVDNLEFSSGIYFYQLSAGDFVETKKMVFLR